MTLSLLILMITLYFGLRFKGFRLKNNVIILQEKQGVRIGKYGIAYMAIDKEQIRRGVSKTEAFSIEMAVKPEAFDFDGFGLILTLHNGRDSDQLIIGQYRSHIIIMNGDDYRNRKKINRISSDIRSESPEKIFLSITTGLEGTRLYVDGRLIRHESNLHLKIPGGDALFVTLGNSVYGKEPWRGELYGAGLYYDIFEPSAIESRYNSWLNNYSFPVAEGKTPFFLFTFDVKNGTDTTGGLAGSKEISIPPYFPVLKKRFLALPWEDFRADYYYLMDCVINLLGFIPIGFIFYTLLINISKITDQKILLITLFACFFVSLIIEITQAWIPSRSSQSIDLILNTAGGYIGAWGAKVAWRVAHRA